MSEPQILSMPDVDATEAVYAGIGFVDTEYAKATVLNLIATVRAKEAKIEELWEEEKYLRKMANDYGSEIERLQSRLNEAVAVMQDIRSHMVNIGKEDGYTVFAIDDFLTKHQYSPTRANDQTTSG